MYQPMDKTNCHTFKHLFTLREFHDAWHLQHFEGGLEGVLLTPLYNVGTTTYVGKEKHHLS